jgi:peptidoglycan/LPS O-acetylase OafA/YrhL
MNARATRFPLFDSLRALAALAIFGTHAYYVLENNGPGPLRQYAARLDVGVFVFFAISGFLLYRPFVRARLRDGAAPAAVAYGWRRLLRIGPAYWVALTIVAAWLGESYVAEPANTVRLYLFGQSYWPHLAVGGLAQAWSLSVEAAFYVFLPLYALGMRSLPTRTWSGRLRSELAGLAALVAIGFGFTALASENGLLTSGLKGFPLHVTLACYTQVFAVGMWMAVLSVWYEDRELPVWLRPLDRFPALGWGLALLAFWAVSTQVGLDGKSGQIPTTGQYVARSALYGVVALGLVAPAVFGDQARGLVRRLLANRVLLWIGLVSYSFFLYHLVVITEVNKWGLGGAAVPGLVAMAISLAIAAASYYAIERPALRLKGLVKAGPEPAPTEAIAEPAPAAPPRVTHAG